ncbi:hypothetical protein LCGC14_0288710 [marine sediment metagenome]|uniref:Uncharacterized protein n=1 Tax=marine sediment metagenome TaxID=412755 RepID=A0A0F9TYN2_9ZZZZ
MQLTKAQKRVLAKLGKRGQTAYQLQEPLVTLRALEEKGFARCSGRDKPGALFEPTVILQWHRAEEDIRVLCGWCGDEYYQDDGDECLCGTPICSDHCMMNHRDKECSEDW